LTLPNKKSTERGGLFTNSQVPIDVLLTISIFLVIFAYLGFDITTYPMVTGDEALLHDPGLQLARTGTFYSDVLKMNPGYEDKYFWQVPGLGLSSAIVFKTLGFGIWQTRAVSIFFGCAAPCVIYLIGSKLGQSRAAGVISAALLFSTQQWSDTAKLARMDTPAITLMLLSTALVLRTFNKRQEAASGTSASLFLAAAGLLTSSAALFHTAAFTWFLGLALCLLMFSRSIWKSSIYVAASATVIGTWLLLGILSFKEFEGQFIAQALNRTGGSDVLSRIYQEGIRYLSDYRMTPIIICVVVIFIMLVLTNWRRAPLESRFLAVLSCSVIILNAVITGKESGFYSIYPITAGIMLIALSWGWLARDVLSGKVTLVLQGVVGLAILNGVALSLAPRVAAALYQGEARNYDMAFVELRRCVRPGDKVWGSAEAWYAVIKAGGSLDAAPEPVPLNWRTEPQPGRHLWVVGLLSDSLPIPSGFSLVGQFGRELPTVAGRTFSPMDYRYVLYAADPARAGCATRG
jgi:4-amino-4-deoxy-L-arabinose transferase-like glycosyltransferase